MKEKHSAIDLKPHKKIRTRILIPMLGLTFVVLLCVASVSLREIMNIGNYAIKQNEELGQSALEISKNALVEHSIDELYRTVVDKAGYINAKLQEIEGSSELLAKYASGLWDNNDIADMTTCYPTTKQPADIKKTAVCLEAPQVDRKALLHDMKVSSKLDVLASSIMANNPNISVIEMGMPSGLFRRLPWSGSFPKGYDPRQRSWYKRAVNKGSLGWLPPYISAIHKTLRVNCYNPVYDSKGSLLGVIGTVIPLDALNQKIIGSHANVKGNPMLVTSDLQIIARKGFKAESQNWKDPLKATHFELDEGTEADIAKIKQMIAKGKSGVLTSRQNGKESLVAFAPIESTKWAFMVVHPIQETIETVVAPTQEAIKLQTTITTAQVDKSITNTIIILFVVVIVLLFIVLLLAHKIADLIVAPVTALIKGVNIIGKGNLDERLDINSGDEIEALANSFNQMAANLQKHIRSLTEETAARERIESDLRMATDIQANLLPKIFPPFPERDEFQIFANMEPAKEVGGDFFDFFFIDDDHFCFIIADVSDKGVPAALYMMVAKTIIKMQALTGQSLDKVMTQVNDFMSEDNDSCMFVTVYAAVINIRTGVTELVNAGHNPPVLYKEGVGWKFLEVKPGMPIGPMPNSTYETASLTMNKGDFMLMYTDGVTEANNPEGKFYEEDRLITCLHAQSTDNAAELVRGIRKDVKKFVSTALPSDDITILGFKYNGPAT